jgi:hypothetical protein
LSYDFTYDDQDRMTSKTYHGYNGSASKEDYTYNTQGLLSEENDSRFWNGEWFPYKKYAFQYNDEGNMTLCIEYTYEENDWMEDEKVEYEYAAGLLLSEVSYYNNSNEWNLSEKTEYTYNEAGYRTERIKYNRIDDEWKSRSRLVYEYDNAWNCLSHTIFDHNYGSEEWILEVKYEYAYDANNNCISFLIYEDFSGELYFDYGFDMAYDLTSDISNIAGFMLFWEDLSGEFEEELGVYNKMLQLTLKEDEEEDIVFDCYYSSTDGINETNDISLLLYPNPATETLYLNADGLRQVEIFNLEGKMVVSQNSNLEAINVSPLAKGVYLLKATFDDGIKAVQKFVKK